MSKQAGISISLAAFFAIIILIFGVFIFSKLMNTTRSAVSEAQIQQFKTTLYSDLETLSSQREASQVKTLPVADQVRAVCFAGSNASFFCSNVPTTDIYYDYEKSICNFLKMSKYESNDNVFFFPQNTHFHVDGVHVQNILCIPASESRIKIHVSVSNGKASIEEYNPYEESKIKTNNAFIEPKKLKQSCSSPNECEAGLTCYEHKCVECTSDNNCSDTEVCYDGECEELACQGNVPIYSYSCNYDNVTFCNLTSPHNVVLENVKDCIDEQEACSGGTCSKPDPDKKIDNTCEIGNGWTFFHISEDKNYNSSTFDSSNSIPCSELDPEEIGNITCDNGKIDTSQCKKDYTEIPLLKEPAIIIGQDESQSPINAQYYLFIIYTNGTREVYKLGNFSDMRRELFYNGNWPSNGQAKVKIIYSHKKNCKHFWNCWGGRGRNKIKEITITYGSSDRSEWLSKYLCGDDRKTACSDKTISTASKEDKLCFKQGYTCYDVDTNINNNNCANQEDSCSDESDYETNSGKLLISKEQSLFIPHITIKGYEVFLGRLGDQTKISKFCCSGSGGSSSSTSSGSSSSERSVIKITSPLERELTNGVNYTIQWRFSGNRNNLDHYYVWYDYSNSGKGIIRDNVPKEDNSVTWLHTFTNTPLTITVHVDAINSTGSKIAEGKKDYRIINPTPNKKNSLADPNCAIWMFNGSSKGIINVKVGDKIWGYNLTSRKITPATVLATIRHNNTESVYNIKLDDGKTISVTGDHKIFIAHPYILSYPSIVTFVYDSAGKIPNAVEAKDLNVNDYVLVFDNKNKRLEDSRIVHISKYNLTQTYYNLETTTHNFFADGILVHNAGHSVGNDDLCFIGLAKVITSEGTKNIGDVRPGSLVLTTEGFEVVSSVEHKKAYVIYKINTDGGVLEATGNHPLLSNAGWVRAANLKEGMRLIGKRGVSYKIRSIKTLFNPNKFDVYMVFTNEGDPIFVNNLTATQ